MVEDIIDACRHLTFRQRKGEFRIQDGKLRHNVTAEHMTDLQLLLVIRNDSACIHLRTCPRHRQNTSDRDDLTTRFFKTDVILFPRIIVTMYRHRYRLCIVAAGTAADCQQEIRLILLCDPDAIPQLFDCRIRHHAAVLHHGLAVCFQDLHHSVIDAVLLDRTAAIDQLNGFAVFGQFVVEVLQRIVSKIQFCCVEIAKISKHCVSSFLILFTVSL